MDETVIVLEEEQIHESGTIPEPSAETGTGETVEELEDRLIAALARNEHLENRIATLESRIATLESSRAVPEPSHSDTPGPPSREPDTPPRSPHPWFRKLGE